MARERKDKTSVWPAFTDTMLAFVLVLVLMMVYQVARSIDVSPPKPEEPTIVDSGGQTPPEVIRMQDQERMRKRIESYRRQGRNVQLRTDGTVQYLTLGSDVTFETGSDVLSPRGRQLVEGLARTIIGTSSEDRIRSLVEIQVGGYTDNIPINTADFPSNWELSTARATRVVKSLVDAGIDPTEVSMSATGYAEFDPRATNSTPRGRSMNRRIEMRLFYTDDSSRQKPSEQKSE